MTLLQEVAEFREAWISSMTKMLALKDKRRQKWANFAGVSVKIRAPYTPKQKDNKLQHKKRRGTEYIKPQWPALSDTQIRSIEDHKHIVNNTRKKWADESVESDTLPNIFALKVLLMMMRDINPSIEKPELSMQSIKRHIGVC